MQDNLVHIYVCVEKALIQGVLATKSSKLTMGKLLTSTFTSNFQGMLVTNKLTTESDLTRVILPQINASTHTCPFDEAPVGVTAQITHDIIIIQLYNHAIPLFFLYNIL